MTTYIAWIRLPNYRTTEVYLQSSDWNTVQLLAESMYGKENVISIRSA